MKKQLKILIYISIFLISFNLNIVTSENSSENILYVDDDGTTDYNNIQDAINNAKNGDKIFVYNGEYNESIFINKSLTIIGENKNNTIINGNYACIIIEIIKDNNTIQNFSIINSGGYQNNSGIMLNSSHNTIKNCIFYRTKTGIFINELLENSIINCSFHTNGEGIYSSNSSNNYIDNCKFFQNGIGINIKNSTKIIINNSYSHTNGIGFFFHQSSFINIKRSAAFNNNDNQGGFFIDNCNNINFVNCIVYHNGFGIALKNSRDISIEKTNISYNTHSGIYISKISTNIEINNSEINNNFRFSIQIFESNLTLKNNNIFNSVCAVNALDSTCQMKNNWWGSKFGPSLFEKKIRDKIKWKNSNIKFIPWKTTKIKEIGANWTIPNNYEKREINLSKYEKIKFEELDTDKDTIPDWWEIIYGYNPYIKDNHEYLDPDKDGLNNIEECYTYKWNSNPFIKDIFLEIDWMEIENSSNKSNKPNDKYISKAIEIFSENNISLHIDIGNLDGGEQIPYDTNFSFADLRDYYWKYFLNNDLNNPRKGIFRYCIICDYGPGNGFAFIGWDNLDSFDISTEILKNQNKLPYSRQLLIIGASIHEIGHTLGLTVDDNGGIDNTIATWPFSIQWWKHVNYRSCMNYFYTYRILGFSDGSNGPSDFNDWENMDFLFFKNTHFILPE